MDNKSSAQKKLISYLKKRRFGVEAEDIPSLLNDIRRFVVLVQKIYTEPQAQVTIRDRHVNGKIIKDQIFNTTPEELEKVRENPSDTTIELIRKAHKKVTRKKYD